MLTAPAAHAPGKPWGTIYTRTSAGNAAATHGDFANNGGVYATVGANGLICAPATAKPT
jgi:hypothetical protein